MVDHMLVEDRDAPNSGEYHRGAASSRFEAPYGFLNKWYRHRITDLRKMAAESRRDPHLGRPGISTCDLPNVLLPRGCQHPPINNSY